MRRKKLFWDVLPSYWLLTAVAIAAVAAYAFHAMSTLYFDTLETDLHARARMLSELLAPEDRLLEKGELDDLCKRLGEASATRFTLIAPGGEVLGDSDEEPAAMEDHGNRPEIRLALNGDRGVNRRYSRTLKQNMMYVCTPLEDETGAILCAVRASLPLTDITERLHAMTLRTAVAALLVGLLSMVICVFVVRLITRPLHLMSQAARRFARGDFSQQIPAQKTEEMNQLAGTLNDMARKLNETLSTLSEQREEQRAVLSSMDEGVMAVSPQGQVLHMNRAAGLILGVDPVSVRKKWVEEVVRFANLQEFIRAVLTAREPRSRDLTLFSETEKELQVRGTALVNDQQESIGALVVLRDVTRVRHLELVRSDFVSNVSHELKTPITSIKGFVETLLSEDWEHAPETRRFLEIIHQQSGRLDAIIDDLLTLSRLEQKQGEVLKEQEALCVPIEDAVALCELRAREKNITIEVDSPPDLTFAMNAPLLEQALLNLLVNAIKYSDPGKTIRVAVTDKTESVVIEVRDEGYGIENRHLERLFERFYRVDTARSRKLGGTGLGLSIVKHIVQAHGGSISVRSRPGQGSTFTLTLPKG